jgi:hypothetical protein
MVVVGTMHKVDEITYLLTYLLTYSMLQHIVSKADCHSAYQKIS